MPSRPEVSAANYWESTPSASSTCSPTLTPPNTARGPARRSIAVTQSGTNALHGSAFEFIRNSALDAKNYFDQGSIPPFRRNQFGGALGGPLKKNRLFLFGNYEGFRQSLALSNVSVVPDATSSRLFGRRRRTPAW